MSNSIWTRLIVAGLATCTIAALAAPASGQTLRRDGSKAEPLVANVSEQVQATPSGVLRRDGSKAVPLVADLDVDASGAVADGFDWGDAAVGAAAAVGLMLLASTSWIVTTRRRRAGVLRGSSA
jgi:hypothetical protein